MSRRLWFCLDTGFTADPRIERLGIDAGPGGPLVIVQLFALARLSDPDDEPVGRATTTYAQLTRRAFLADVEDARTIVRRAAELGIVEVLGGDENEVTIALPRWHDWQWPLQRAENRRKQDRERKSRDRPRTVRGKSADSPPLTRTRTTTQTAATPNGVAASAISGDERPEIGRLCHLLADRIVANDSRAKVSPDSDAWRTSARLLLDSDGRSEEEIRGVIEWCQADDFWRSNVLSMGKLRDKFGQLALKMRSTPASAPVSENERRLIRSREAAREATERIAAGVSA